jgi:hypothetical protein
MRRNRSLAAFLVWVFFISSVGAQVSAPQQHLVHDWSSRHVVFTGLTPGNLWGAVRADPRAWHSWVEHARYSFEPPRRRERELSVNRHHRHRRRRTRQLLADWEMPIFGGVGPWATPAKFGFDVNAVPDCTNDYVVFPTSGPGTPGLNGVPATLIAFNNLYTGPGPTGICPSPSAPAAQPSVLFAYNTTTTDSGKTDLSPVVSLDGKKIAFMESNDGFTSNYTAFHVLTWVAGEGTVTSASPPGDCSQGHSCMATLVLSTSHSDSRSNPFVDYAHDTAYVGDDGGLLHKITPVFSGTPAEVLGNGWPVQLAPAFDQVHSPVYDSASGRIFVTDDSGNNALYVVDGGSGAVLRNDSLNAIVVSDLIVDSTNQTVFVFLADSSLNLAVAQVDTSGALLRRIVVASLAGSASVYTGAFDQNYFINPSSGSLYFAGAVNAHATLYSVGFTDTTMNATFSGPLVLSTSPTTSTPTPLTESFNPSFSTSPDRLFVGIDANCENGSANGCIESFDISNGFPSGILSSRALGTNGAVFSVSGIIIDNVSSSAQASSIYFESTPQGLSQSAIKLTQLDLQ